MPSRRQHCGSGITHERRPGYSGPRAGKTVFASRRHARKSTFSSFQEDYAAPPLGIQLTVIGGPEDFFFRLRDYLISRPEANARYNALKRRFEGATMDEYRAAKSAFLEALLAQLDPGGNV